MPEPTEMVRVQEAPRANRLRPGLLYGTSVPDGVVSVPSAQTEFGALVSGAVKVQFAENPVELLDWLVVSRLQ